jgi:hypothetical protein
MRKISFLFFCALLFLFCLSSFALKARATDLSASSSSAPEINYELAYPGLLPDNPLYFLRAIRDRVVGFLISDPLKKSEFDLLQADKRLNAGIYLFNKGKISLAFSTISKAENYFEEAISKIKEAKTQREDINGTQGKLENALKKHEQELSILSEKSNANFKASFQSELKRVTGFEERLSQ